MTKSRICKQCNNTQHVKLSYIERQAKCKVCGSIEHTLEQNTLYYLWKAMVSRCHNVSDRAYPQYGKYGVTVCNEWKESFDTFAIWAMSNGYNPTLFIDKDLLCDKLKISPHVYSPSTCQFVDRFTNNQKTRRIKSTNTSGYRGITFNKNMKDYPWEAKICVKKQRIRLGFWRTKLEAAKAYDYYITSNRLLHTINGVLQPNEAIDIDTANNRIRSNNTSGVKGVAFRSDTNKWQAYITLAKKRYSLGSFSTKEEAKDARLKADQNYSKDKKWIPS